MTSFQPLSTLWGLPGDLCRLQEPWIHKIARQESLGHLMMATSVLITLGSSMYGLVLGSWRSDLQAVLSAIKMPVLIFSTVLISSVINSMLAKVLGTYMTFRQVMACIFISLGMASVLMAALGPIVLFLTLQMPAPGEPQAFAYYRLILILHTTVVGICGLAGNIRLFQLLRALNLSKKLAAQTLLIWILVSGLTGAEIAWVISPFLAKPDEWVPWINPDAFHGNVFEYLWRMAAG
jgi:hypothetical protein